MTCHVTHATTSVSHAITQKLWYTLMGLLRYDGLRKEGYQLVTIIRPKYATTDGAVTNEDCNTA